MKTKLVIFIILFLYLTLFIPTYAKLKDNNMNIRKTIAIDLDGVLDDYKKYDENKIPKIRQGAREFIQELHKNGYNLVLFTNRKPLLASKWLIENNLDKYFSDVTNIKPKATMYIDDRAIKFDGNYDTTLDSIKRFKVYWKD